MNPGRGVTGVPAGLTFPPRLGIVFDLDGTLIDSRLDIAQAANHALRGHGFAALSSAELAGYVGDGARLLLARAGRLDPSDGRLEPLLETFIAYYAAHPADHTDLLPGAREALAALAAVPLALCTNKPRSITNAVLAQLRLSDYFSVVLGGGDLPVNKPDPLPLRYIAEQLGRSPNELVMVGDGQQDICCAKAAGARSVGVLGGMQGDALLLAAAPDLVVQSLHELPSALAAWLSP